MAYIEKYTGDKSPQVKCLIESMLAALDQVGIPFGGLTQRRLEKMALTCLAVGGIRKGFAEAKSAEDGHFLKTRDIIEFENSNYAENISPGSYDDVRRKDLALPVEAGAVVNSANVESQATNNPTRGYALSAEFAALLRTYGTADWEKALRNYKERNSALRAELERRRELERVPVLLPSGEALTLSAGEHNVLQKAIIEEFMPRFGMGAELLYVGDTSDKFLYLRDDKLKSVGFFKLEHEELPDVVAYSAEKNLLFMVEAVHSAGPMSELRVRKLKRLLSGCTADLVFVTAFQTRLDFRKWVADIAWETEVWIADSPDHMVHFNGYKFLDAHK